MYEHRSEELVPKRVFFLRLARSALIAILVIGGSLVLGILGYHYTENLSWLDSLLNAAMILTGMGPVSPLQSDSSKLFASFYALYSGIAFLSICGLLFAPVIHRFFHKFHLEDKED